MTTTEPPRREDELEELKLQLVRAIADEAECRKVAAGFKNFSDKQFYLQRAEFYGRIADDRERCITKLLSPDS